MGRRAGWATEAQRDGASGEDWHGLYRTLTSFPLGWNKETRDAAALPARRTTRVVHVIVLPSQTSWAESRRTGLVPDPRPSDALCSPLDGRPNRSPRRAGSCCPTDPTLDRESCRVVGWPVSRQATSNQRARRDLAWRASCRATSADTLCWCAAVCDGCSATG